MSNVSVKPQMMLFRYLTTIHTEYGFCIFESAKETKKLQIKRKQTFIYNILAVSYCSILNILRINFIRFIVYVIF